MKHLPAEIERLMWLVAEGSDSRAIADFEARFPDLKHELSKRISMVRSLKSAGKTVHTDHIPRFVPRVAAPRPMFGRSMYIAFAVMLGALAFGSYSVTAWMNRPVP